MVSFLLHAFAAGRRLFLMETTSRMGTRLRTTESTTPTTGATIAGDAAGVMARLLDSQAAGKLIQADKTLKLTDTRACNLVRNVLGAAAACQNALVTAVDDSQTCHLQTRQCSHGTLKKLNPACCAVCSNSIRYRCCASHPGRSLAAPAGGTDSSPD